MRHAIALAAIVLSTSVSAEVSNDATVNPFIPNPTYENGQTTYPLADIGLLGNDSVRYTAELQVDHLGNGSIQKGTLYINASGNFTYLQTGTFDASTNVLHFWVNANPKYRDGHTCTLNGVTELAFLFKCT